MSRKSIFILGLILVFVTFNVYLFYSAPEDVNNTRAEEVEYTYSSQELFTILAGVNDKTRTLYTKSIVGSHRPPQTRQTHYNPEQTQSLLLARDRKAGR